jgi:hypothetical protein
MSDEKLYTLEEAHKPFAIQFHGEFWTLHDQPERTADENERMLSAAFASLHHWRAAGTPLHHQRGEWLISRAYAVLGEGANALTHARRCLELLEAHKDLMQDFDFAFAYESMARAYALSGEVTDARNYIALAHEAGNKIQDGEDRKIFFDDFNGGNWNGVKP